jgi:hypothetical protein
MGVECLHGIRVKRVARSALCKTQCVTKSCGVMLQRNMSTCRTGGRFAKKSHAKTTTTIVDNI